MDKIATIKNEAEELLKKMIDDFELTAEEDTENQIYQLTVKTNDEASTIIGRHGETIRAIQKILEVILYKKIGEPARVLLNVNDYREKQKERLEQLAGELAEKTQSVQRPTHYRGLSSYERRIVHEYITNKYPDLTTFSVGEGRDRHLVIDLKSSRSENNGEE
jgi:spoIIIJ-associated protein